MNFIKKWFENRRNAQFEKFLENKKSKEAKDLELVEEAFKRLTVAQQETVKESNDPWVKIESAEVDEFKGIKLKLDWNPAFIQFLRDNGFTGVDEENMVQKYIGALYKQMYTEATTDALDLNIGEQSIKH